jgi:hypothetical protein
MKRFSAIIVILSALILLSTAFVSAANFETDKYDVDVKVLKDNSWLVTETISMNFISPSHGIFRYIPYRGYIYYMHENQVIEKPYKISITDVKIPGYSYEKYNENSNLVLKIGSGDIFVEGPLTYEISYKVTAYNDNYTKLDQFYWGLLPIDWNTSI